MAVLPPPPVNDKPGSFTWLEWYRQLRNYVSTSGSVPWYIINFSGSNIRDIALRNHADLQGQQGGTSGEHYHLTQRQYTTIQNYIELLSTTASTAVPTTPTLLKPATTVVNNGITYDSSTGEITFVNGGTFTFSFSINARSTTSNKKLYFYAEDNTGSGWNTRRYSARDTLLKSSSTEQIVFGSANYFPAGTKLRLYLWGETTGMTLETADVPGTTAGTVTIPAIRLMFAGGL